MIQEPANFQMRGRIVFGVFPLDAAVWFDLNLWLWRLILRNGNGAIRVEFRGSIVLHVKEVFLKNGGREGYDLPVRRSVTPIQVVWLSQLVVMIPLGPF